MTPRALAAALASTLAAGPAFAGPDFVTADRTEPLAASDGRSVHEPLDDIAYARDSAALSQTAQVQLAAAARWLDVHPDHRVVLEGYADTSGSPGGSQDLATRRVQIARNHLIVSGVAADRIVLAVYGANREGRQRTVPLDRGVVMFATAAELSRVVATELDRDAIELSWTHGGSVYRETRGITPVTPTVPEVSLAARNRAARRHGG